MTVLLPLLGRRGLAAVEDVELVTLVLACHVVTDLGSVDETKGESVLLTDLDTLGELSRAVALLKLIG